MPNSNEEEWNRLMEEFSKALKQEQTTKPKPSIVKALLSAVIFGLLIAIPIGVVVLIIKLILGL